MQLEGKVCVVTGSGSGIGRATALEMARRGARVVVSDIADGDGQATVELIEGEGGEATYIHADVCSRDEIVGLVDGTIEAFGRLDVLHNNAGVHETDFTGATLVDELPEEVWDRVVDINLKAVWLCSKYAI